MMPTIRLDDDVFQGLKSLAEPFTDTPNSVIRRLLVEHGALPASKTPKVEPQAAPQRMEKVQRGAEGLTPQPVYESFLLHVLLKQFHGHGGKHEVTKAVVGLMQSRGFINSADLERVSTGETKAENTIAWGRNALKEGGLISRNSPRGEWELTPKGKEEAARRTLPSR